VSQLLGPAGASGPTRVGAPACCSLGLSGAAAPCAQLLEKLYPSCWALLGFPVPPGWAAQRAALWG